MERKGNQGSHGTAKDGVVKLTILKFGRKTPVTLMIEQLTPQTTDNAGCHPQRSLLAPYTGYCFVAIPALTLKESIDAMEMVMPEIYYAEK